MSRGHYITIDGCKGIKKTTLANKLYNYLWENNVRCIRIKEPSFCETSDKIINILMEYELPKISNLCLITAARAEIFEKQVIPHLENNITIISEKSPDSTIAYQGYGEGIDIGLIQQLNSISTKGTKPDISIIIDIDPEVGLKKESFPDKFSEKGIDYHKRVRQGYLDIVKNNQDRCFLIEYGDGDLELINKKIQEIVYNKLLKK